MLLVAIALFSVRKESLAAEHMVGWDHRDNTRFVQHVKLVREPTQMMNFA